MGSAINRSRRSGSASERSSVPTTPTSADRPRTITAGGLPGTGSSTLCRALELELGLPYVYAGQMFRQEAARRGYSLAEFNALAQEDPSVDRALDDRQLELLRAGNVILEGRLAGWLAAHHRIEAFKIWVVCGDEERLRRLVDRDGADLDEQARRAEDRVARETDRYRRYYGADVGVLSLYDAVLDSTTSAPDALVREVVDRLPWSDDVR